MLKDDYFSLVAENLKCNFEYIICLSGACESMSTKKKNVLLNKPKD